MQQHLTSPVYCYLYTFFWPDFKQGDSPIISEDWGRAAALLQNYKASVLKNKKQKKPQELQVQELLSGLQ